MSQRKASVQRPYLVHICPSGPRKTRGVLNTTHKRTSACTDAPLTWARRRSSVRFVQSTLVSRVMTPDILLSLVPDWAGIQPIMSEWERVWQRHSRGRHHPHLNQDPRLPGFLHSAASDWTRIASFSPGFVSYFFLVAPTAPLLWSPPYLFLGECFGSL